MSPQNVAVVAGDPIQLTCGSSEATRVEWSYWEVGQLGLLGRFDVDQRNVRQRNDHEWTLQYENASLSQAGTYQCSPA